MCAPASAQGPPPRRARSASGLVATDAASGFSTITCFPALSAARGERVVCRDRRCDHDRVDACVRQHLVVAPWSHPTEESDGISAPARAARGRRRRSPHSGNLMQVPDQVWSPIPKPTTASDKLVSQALDWTGVSDGDHIYQVSVRRAALMPSRLSAADLSGVRSSRRRSSPSDQLRTYATSMSSASP